MRPLTAKGIAAVLCWKDRDEAFLEICPPWMDTVEGVDSAFSKAWKGVQELRRQRDALIELWPARKIEMENQFNDQVMVLARDFHEACEVTP